MIRLLRFSVSHPVAVLASILLCTACMSVFIPNVRLKLDARSLVPSNDSSFTKSDQATKLFDIRDVVMLGVFKESSDIYDTKSLTSIQQLTDKLASAEGVVAPSVASLATTPNVTISNGEMKLEPVISRRMLADPQAPSRVRNEVEELNLNDGIFVASDGRAAAVFADIRPDADRFALIDQVRKVAAEESHSG